MTTETNITGTTYDPSEDDTYCGPFAMFTEEGDILVEGIVDYAKETNADWPSVYKKLEMLGKTKGFEEATDTMVREAVFDAIGYDDNVSFWV